MPQFSPKAGVDCSSDRLDVHIHPLETAFSVANDAEGWKDLDRRLAAAQVEVVAIEASGGCELPPSRKGRGRVETAMPGTFPEIQNRQKAARRRIAIRS